MQLYNSTKNTNVFLLLPSSSLQVETASSSNIYYVFIYLLIVFQNPYTGASGVPSNFFFFFGWGGSTNSVEDRGQKERGSGGGTPLVRGSGGSCNLVQEISFHMVKFS